MMEHCLNFSLDNNVSGDAGAAQDEGREGDAYLRELAHQVEHYVMKRAVPVVSSLGLLGNLLSLLVMTKENLYKSASKMEISAHIGLMGLAVSDLLFCLMVLLVTSLPLQPAYRPGDPLVYFDLLLGAFITVFIITSTWLIVIMAAERYVAVCHPLRARRLISLRRTRAYVLALFLLGPLCTLPIFLEKYVKLITCTDGSVLYLVANVSRDSLVVRRVIWALCFDFVPCGALTYFNACLVWKIRKAKQLRHRMAPVVPLDTRMYSKSNGVRRFRWDGRQCQCPSNNEQPGVGSSNTSSNSSSNKARGVRASFLQERQHRRKWQQDPQQESSASDSLSQGQTAGSQRRRDRQLLCHRHAHLQRPSLRNPNRELPAHQTRLEVARRRVQDTALNSVTASLVAVVLTFLLLVSPWELLKFGVLYSSSPFDRYKMDIVHNLTNFMQTLNFSFNFLLYCLVNRSFRNTLQNLFCLPQIRICRTDV